MGFTKRATCYRGIVQAALSFAACAFLAACGSHQVSNPTANTSEIPTKLTSSLKFSDMEIRLVSKPAGSVVTFKVDFTLVGDTPEQEEAVKNLMSPSEPVFGCLVAYIEHATWQYMNDGIKTNGVEIHAPESAIPRHGGWWLYSADHVMYDKNTLSLTQDGKIIEYLPQTVGAKRDWIPFTGQTYPAWWSEVDRRLKLTERFGGNAAPPAGK